MEKNPFEECIIKMISSLYKEYSFSCTDIQYVIDIFTNFIKEHYNPLLLKVLSETVLKNMDSNCLKMVNDIFQKYSNPFAKFETERKRITIFKNRNLFVEPKKCLLEEKTESTYRTTQLSVKAKSVYAIHMPIRYSMTKLFEMEGLFQATMSHIQLLKNEESIMSNFIQGTLWKEKIRSFHADDIILPLGVFFDDVETGNAQGTHAGKNAVGCVYISVLCFPPSVSSKLQSIIMSDIFYTQDRSKYGTRAIFKELINDLNDLRRNGISIKVNDKIYKIYFVTCVVLGDNKGLNDICGFVKSFALSHCCRFCYAGPEMWKTMIEEDDSILRTFDKYLEDVKYSNSCKTGIIENSVFNDLDDFNVIANGSVDVMHDIFEGVANYVMTQILLKFIDEKYFDIQYINSTLKCMDFSFEKTNIPLAINLDYVKKHNKLRMSASEMLFFTRYFGLMVGDKIKYKNNEYWILYITLREIIDILTAPKVTKCDLQQLKYYIKKLNTLYVKLFETLKSKFHNMLHYIRLIEQNGPAIHLSAMRYESYHRNVRKIIQATASRKNILYTVGKRYILGLSYYKFISYKHLNMKDDSEENDNFSSNYFQNPESKILISCVMINDFTYKKNTIIVVNIGEIFPTFGEIQSIYVQNNKVYFNYIAFNVIGFNQNYFAYSVEKDCSINNICYDALPTRVPCIIDNKEGATFIATRFRL